MICKQLLQRTRERPSLKAPEGEAFYNENYCPALTVSTCEFGVLLCKSLKMEIYVPRAKLGIVFFSSPQILGDRTRSQPAAGQPGNPALLLAGLLSRTQATKSDLGEMVPSARKSLGLSLFLSV